MNEPEGVWCVIDVDYNETITAPYASEIEALRAINGRGYGSVLFVPWGKTVAEAKRA